MVENNKPLQNFNKKNIPSSRNGYSFNCNYTYDKINGRIVEQKKNVYDKDIVCVFMKDKPTNNFPVIIYKDLLNELSPIPINGYEILDNKIKIKKEFLNNAAYTYREEKARKVALEITNQLWNNLSFGPEIVFLDEIVFRKNPDYDWLYSYELAKYKVTNNNFLHHGRNVNAPDTKTNFRSIELYVRAYEKRIKIVGDNLVFSTSINNGFNKGNDEFKSVAFDVYETFYSLTREYGKYLYSINNFDAKTFLSTIQPFIKDYEKRKKFFYFYKYFNSLNNRAEANFSRRKDNNSIELSVADKNILKSFRRYFASNIINLSSEFTEYSDDMLWQRDTYNKIKYSLLHYPLNTDDKEMILDERRKYPVPDIVNRLSEAMFKNADKSSGKLIDKEAYDQFYLHIIKAGYFAYAFNKEDSFVFDSASSNILSAKRYYLLSANYVPSSTGQAIQIGDVFPSQVLVNTNKNYKDSKYLKATETGCLAEYVNQRSLSDEHFEAKVLKRIVKNNISPSGVSFTGKNYIELSKEIDKEMLNALSNYFSSENLFASLYAILAFKYPDKRHTVGGCLYSYEHKFVGESKTPEFTIARSKQKGLNQFADYLQFYMFGISLFGQERERKIFNSLLKYARRNNRLFYYDARTYEFQQKEFSKDIPIKRMFSYSYNVITTNKEIRRKWSTIYIPLFVKLNEPKNAFQLKAEFNNKSVSSKNKAIDYDYNNFYLITTSLTHSSIDNYKELHHSFVYDDYRNRDKYVGIVLVLGGIYGSLVPVYKINGITSSVAQSTEVVRGMKRLYLDRNGNSFFDIQNEKTVAIDGP